MKSCKELLDEVIARDLEELKNFTPGTEEKASAVIDLERLHGMRMEEIKSENDTKLRVKEESNKLTEARKDRFIKVTVAGVELVLPLIFYGMWMNRGFKFEETGCYTSGTFKDLIHHFRPKK